MSLDAFPDPVDLGGFPSLDELTPRQRAQVARRAGERQLDTTPFQAGDGLFADWGTGQVFDRGDPNARGIDGMLDSDGTARQLEQVLTLPIRAADHALIGGSDRGRKLIEEVFPEPQRRQFIGQQTSGIAFRKAFFELSWVKDGRRIRMPHPPAFRPATACEQLYNRETGAPDGFRKRVHDPGGQFNALDWRRWYGEPMPGWIPIGRQRSHVYVHGTHRQPLKGISDLSVCWWAYETRKKLLWLWVKYCERAIAPIVGVYGRNATEAAANAKAMSGLRGGGYAPLVRPDEPSAKAFEILEASTAAAGLFESCSRFLEGHMVDSVLAGFTKLSTGAAAGGRGSQALGESDKDYFQKARQAVANEQSLQTTTDVFAPICLYNGMKLADVPQQYIPLNADHMTEALEMAGKLITAPTVNAPDEFLDGLLMVVAPTLGLDADRLRDALEDYRAQQAQERDRMAEQFEQAGMEPGQVDEDGNPVGGFGQPMPGQQPGQQGVPPDGPGPLRPRPGAPNARGADLANVVDAAWSLVRTTQETGDPDGALDALTGRRRTERTHIDLAAGTRDGGGQDTTSDEDEHTGGMVALVPDAASRAKLAVKGGEKPGELHVTLVYLGDDVRGWSPDQRQQVIRRAEQLAARTAPVEARAFAHATFNPDAHGDRKPCAVYLIGDTAALPRMHQELRPLASALQHPGYVPHLTGGYGLTAADLSYTGDVRFDHIAVALAGDWLEIPLTGGTDRTETD